jgi:hypothetical protein
VLVRGAKISRPGYAREANSISILTSVVAYSRSLILWFGRRRQKDKSLEASCIGRWPFSSEAIDLVLALGDRAR